ADEVEEGLQDIIDDSDSTEEEFAKAQQKLAVVDRARETLTQEAARETYNTSGVEATVYGEMLTDEILHMTIKKMSPTSFTELQQVANEFDQYQDLDTLILDLRGNIGGSVDLMPYFLGPFIGPNQYAYELYHQGEYEPYKTLVGWLPSLVRYKNVVILQDEVAQSSAEVMTSVLKKYNVGILVGTTSRGWGTIEAVYELDNQISDDETYKMFLVNAVTIRDDNQPIEGRGVDPLVDIADENWPDLLYTYVNDNALVRAVEKLID
ncbi:MAG: S41 family peptidase, partial [Candidatus Komeilibacteria bacterium]